RTDQSERRQVDADGARTRPLADDQVELKILHRRVEDLLDRRRQAMDLVDEQDVVRLQIGQQRGEVAGALDNRPRSGAKTDAELAGDDLRQGRLAEPGRAEEQHMIERLAPSLGRFDEDAQIVAQLALADELVERRWTQRGLGGV